MDGAGQKITKRETPRTRDAALDLLRCIALIRVVFWHLFANTWMTWVAAIPVMFFVAGTLLERPGRYVTFLGRRLRRILLPLWVYGATVAVASLWFAEPTGVATRSLSGPLTWVLPVVDPTSTGWDGGWLSSHLWYIRAYLWILVLTPLLIKVAHRIRWAVIGTACAVVGLEFASRLRTPVIGHGAARVLLGDAVVYGFFAVLGIRYRSGGRIPSPRRCLAAWLVLGSLAVAFARVYGLPDGGVNDSYPAVLMVGCAWLAFIGAVERPIRTLAERVRVRRATRAMSSRSLTVYLWHPACIVIARGLVPGHGVAEAIVVVPVTGALIVVAVAVVGWVETVASGRRSISHLRAGRATKVGVGAMAATLLAAAALPIIDGRTFSAAASGTHVKTLVVGTPAPSAREALSNAAFGPPPTARAAPSVPPSVPPTTPVSPTTPVTSAPPVAVDPVDTTIAETLEWTLMGVPSSAVPISPPVSVLFASRPAAKVSRVGTSPNRLALKSVTSPAVSRTTAPLRPAPSSTTLTTSIPPITSTSAAAKAPSPAPQATFPTAALQRTLDTWRAAEQPAISSMIVSLRSGSQTWTSKSTADGAFSNYQPDAPFPAASITKTFTAALVIRELEKGTLKLDDPVPVLTGLDVQVPPGITVRRLLTHTAGLVDYTAAPGYRADQPLTALQAVELSLHAPQQDGLGLTVRYANAGYLYLGVLLEQVTGQSYGSLVDGLTRDAGLHDTKLSTDAHAGWVGFSSGGIVSTAADLAAWGQALFGSGKILSAHGVSVMTTLGDMNLGLGAWPACPCWTDAGGVKRYTAIGHHTGDGGMFYFPTTGMTIVAMFEPTGDDTHSRIVSLMSALSATLKAS